MVGLGTEMQVYSQWRAVTDGTLSPSDTMTFAPTATLKKVIEASRGGGAGKVVALSMTPEAGIGLFEGAAAISPVFASISSQTFDGTHEFWQAKESQSHTASFGRNFMTSNGVYSVS